MINFDDKTLFLEKLQRLFRLEEEVNISSDVLTQYEGEIVYNYFYGKTWYDLAINLDFKLDGEPLEKGCIYLNHDDFKKYFPLYIYASLINYDGWAFECSFFMHYLMPDVMGEDVYFEFIVGFDELQRSLIYEFVLYKFVKENDLMASDAFNKFWCLYS